MRNIDITRQDVRCCDIYVDIDNINVAYELWFDVDKYFGININDSDSVWINFYTYWFPNKEISAQYTINSDAENKSFDWELTIKEKEYFFKKMEEFCYKSTGLSLQELWDINCNK